MYKNNWTIPFGRAQFPQFPTGSYTSCLFSHLHDLSLLIDMICLEFIGTLIFNYWTVGSSPAPTLIYKDHLTLIIFFRFISHISPLELYNKKCNFPYDTGLSVSLKSFPCLPNFFFSLLENVFFFSDFFWVNHFFLIFFPWALNILPWLIILLCFTYFYKIRSNFYV